LLDLFLFRLDLALLQLSRRLYRHTLTRVERRFGIGVTKAG
jgi:hypothetical protein